MDIIKENHKGKNIKIKALLKGFSISIGANLVTIMVSLIVTLILPKFISVEQYGYWQVYLFYTTYIGIFHLGITDGIYLRYGGKQYEELDYGMFHAIYVKLVKLEVIIAVGLIGISMFSQENTDKIIFISLAVCMFMTNIRYLFLYILQTTNRIKEFAIITIVDRVVFIAVCMLCIIAKHFNFIYIIGGDIIGRIISLFIAQKYCCEIVKTKAETSCDVNTELKKNISAGSKLLFANLASSCIIGIVRFGIQKCWSVSVFGKISLMLSISNFFIIFINAIGIVLYPALKRTSDLNKEKLYDSIDILINSFLFATLVLYYPVILLINWWLPEYRDFLLYVGMLFPIYIYEGKTGLLYTTYMKVYRKEGVIFTINIVFVLLSAVFTGILAFGMKNLTGAVMAILILIAGRCLVNQIYLGQKLKVKWKIEVLEEIVMTMLFVYINTFYTGRYVWVIVTVAIVLYEVIRFKKNKNAIRKIKQILQ